MNKRPQTEAEILASITEEKLSRVAPGDELGRARAIKIAKLQAPVWASVAHLLPKVPDDQ